MRASIRRPVLEVLLALAVANAFLLLALLGETTGWAGARDARFVLVAVGFALGFGILTLLRDRWPRIVLVIAAVLICAHYTVGLPSIGVVLPLAVFLVATTMAGHRWFAAGGALLLFAVAAFFRLLDGTPAELVLGYELMSNLAIAGLAIALAEVVRARRALQTSQARAVALAADAARAETEREQLAERGRIARALHDDLGHSLAIVSLHANAAAERVDDPVTARSLGHVRAASASALGQLREAVRALGSSAAPAVPGSRRRDLEEMLAALRDAGIEVDVEGTTAGLAGAIGMVASRVAQEGVTNALRHARPTRLRIVIDDLGPLVRVTVEHDGAPAGAAEVVPGGGLTGLRDRVEAVGGHLDWAAEDGGFRLTADLPHTAPADAAGGAAPSPADGVGRDLPTGRPT